MFFLFIWYHTYITKCCIFFCVIMQSRAVSHQIREGELSLIPSYIGTTKSSKEVVVRKCSVKKVFLEVLQNSKENTCARASFLIKLQWGLRLYYKNRPWHRRFPVNFAKFLKTTFIIKHFWWLLLQVNQPGLFI